ncbi:beta-L-arabinofuranosidase domain-containing protein, partial [Streptomyces flaveolus]|uniref:beta-L-arabinofuranosidase domain-containing protein n=1 Tax=Streptomyces flaveolus TaxID=67297 RepID=UPI003F57487F
RLVTPSGRTGHRCAPPAAAAESPGAAESGPTPPLTHSAPTPALTPFPRSAVRLLESPFLANMCRTCAYLLFVDVDRLPHTFRLNVGLPSAAEPCGGWEAPTVQLRGHTTGHLLSALAQAHANTGVTARIQRSSSRRTPVGVTYITGQMPQIRANWCTPDCTVEESHAA